MVEFLTEEGQVAGEQELQQLDSWVQEAIKVYSHWVGRHFLSLFRNLQEVSRYEGQQCFSMTILIGILCQDGVVVGSDSSATFVSGHQRTIEQKCKKIEVLSRGHVILAGTGGIGMGQRFSNIVEEYFENTNNRNKLAISIVTDLSVQGIQDFKSTDAPQNFGALLAFCAKKSAKSSKKHFTLCEFDDQKFQPELKTDNLWYVAMGSGQVICDPFLGFQRRVFWKNDKPPLRSDGVFATIWTLQHAIDLNPGGIKDPIEVAVLENNENGAVARMLGEGELDEHRSNIVGLEEHISPALLSGQKLINQGSSNQPGKN